MVDDDVTPVEGSSIAGPECKCGGTEWFVKGDTVICAENNHKREIPGLHGFLLDGPECGGTYGAFSKRCGGTDWFVGEDILVCANREHDRTF